MDSNRRYPEDRDYPEDKKSRNLEENQRVGRDISRSRGDQPYNEQYRSGNAYHNRGEGYSPEQTHYGSRPDSAYRDQSRINYGDNRQNAPGQRYGQNQDRNQSNNQNRFGQRNAGNNQSSRGQSGYGNQNKDYYNDPPHGDHAGTEFWGEREGYKEDDYRYSSGNRGNWHTPGTDDDNNRSRNYRQQNQNPNFFDRMSERIDNAWDRMTGNHHDDDNDRNRNYDRNQHPQNRNFNRGYESGPRWADEDDRDHQRNRHNRRDDY